MALEKAVAHAARSRLQTLSGLTLGGQVEARTAEGDAQPVAQPCHGRRPFAGAGVEAVVQMSRMDLEPEPARHLRHAPEKGGRVGAARGRDQQPVAGGGWLASPEEPFQVVDQRRFAAWLIDGSDGGRDGQDWMVAVKGLEPLT